METSLVIPAKNEASTIASVVVSALSLKNVSEVVVVDDGSSDETGAIARRSGARVISHPYSLGNGAAIKSGARVAKGDVLVFMDADGQHDPADIPRLLTVLHSGYDMVVGARSKSGQASVGRGLANALYNKLASYVTGHRVDDLTSGFRVAKSAAFREFISLLPNGFSYPTTSTMAFFRAGYSVAYEPIDVKAREGKSHINVLKDGLRFLLIIFKVGTLYSPLKLFTPASAAFFLLGIGYYLFTLLTQGRFTNMSALLFSTSVIIFFMGLISEQITQLMYKDTASAIASNKREADEDPN